MQASSANFSVEQVELIRRLRNSGITCEQLINAFQALERIDAILGNTFNAPVNSRLQQHIRNYDGGNHKENETSPAISTSATVLGEPSCSQPLLTLLTPPVSMKVPVRNPSSEQNTHEGLQGFSQTQTTSALNSPDESPPEHLLPEIELHTKGKAPVSSSNSPEISGPSQSECGNATLNQRVASSDPTKLPSEELTQDHCLALLWRSGYDKVMNVVNKCLTTHEFQPLQQAKEIGVKGSSMQAFLRGDFFCIDQSTCYNLMGWLIKICHNAEWFKVEMEKLLDPQDNQEESDVQLVPRRERITYLECHLQVLETFWLNNQYPTPSEKELIAERCNHAMAVWAERPLEDKEKLSHLNVANWFKNKRKINRRNAKKGESRGEATKTFLDHPNVNSTANQAANSPLIGEHEQASSTQQNVSQTLRKRLHPSSFVRIPSDLGYNHSSSSVSDEHEQANSNQHVSQTLQERLHPESASSSIVRILSNFSNNYFDSNNSNTASTMLSSLSSQVAKDSWKVSSSSHLDPVAESHPVHLFQNSAFAHSAAVAGSSDVEGHTNPVTVDEIPGSPTNNPVPAVMAATSNSHESAVVFRESDDEVDTKPFALVSMSDSLPHNPVPALTAVTPDIHDSAVHRGSDDEVDTKPAIVDSMPGSPTHNPVPALTAATPDSHESADVKEEAIYPMPTIKV